jgi:2-oxoglutarate dehydrogenase E2 component (dihydrolipoamide succinyltransferase)
MIVTGDVGAAPPLAAAAAVEPPAEAAQPASADPTAAAAAAAPAGAAAAAAAGEAGAAAAAEGGRLQQLLDSVKQLDSATAEASRELDAAAPPPLKGALEAAARKVAETDFSPLAQVMRRVAGDLGEGFAGLGASAGAFDPGEAAADLKSRFEKEYAARQEAPPEAAAPGAAADGEPAAAAAPAGAAPPPAAPAPAAATAGGDVSQ